MKSRLIDIEVRKMSDTRDALSRAIEAMTAHGALGKGVRHVTVGAQRYAAQHTVEDTGTWRASQTAEVNRLRGRVFIDPNNLNPKSKSRPVDYGARLEITRGGRYAAYEQTVNQAGWRLLKEAGQIIEDEL